MYYSGLVFLQREYHQYTVLDPDQATKYSLSEKKLVSPDRAKIWVFTCISTSNYRRQLTSVSRHTLKVSSIMVILIMHHSWYNCMNNNADCYMYSRHWHFSKIRHKKNIHPFINSSNNSFMILATKAVKLTKFIIFNMSHWSTLLDHWHLTINWV